MAPHQRWAIAVTVAVTLLLVNMMAILVSTEPLHGAIDFQTVVGAKVASSAPEFRCGYEMLLTRGGVVEDDNETPAVVGDNGVEGHLGDAVSSASIPFKPIRIKLLFPDLENKSQYCQKVGQVRPDFNGGNGTCKHQDVLTKWKKRILKTRIAPAARRLHSKRLRVQRMTTNVPISRASGRGYCRLFSIPEKHIANGIPRADFVLYVASGVDSSTVAWASTCAKLPTGRPMVGVAYFSTAHIEDDVFSARVLAHELLHAMGFRLKIFRKSGIFKELAEGPRGKPNEVPVIDTPKVLAAARAHFNCPTLSYVELEDRGSVATAGSHWKMRNMKDDLMAPTGRLGYYTAMTMAVMEDLGYYIANYEMAEVMPWGRNAGCDLFNKKCVEEGRTQHPSLFCTRASHYLECASDRRYMGNCTVGTSDTPLPSYFQYFSDPKHVSTSDPFMDHCPVIQPSEGSDCTAKNTQGVLLSLTGRNARCFDITPLRVPYSDSTTLVGSICAKVVCKNCKYSVRVTGATKATPCSPGSTLSLPDLSSEFKEGSLMCPPYSEVCTDTVNPSSENGPFTPLCDK